MRGEAEFIGSIVQMRKLRPVEALPKVSSWYAAELELCPGILLAPLWQLPNPGSVNSLAWYTELFSQGSTAAPLEVHVLLTSGGRRAGRYMGRDTMFSSPVEENIE